MGFSFMPLKMVQRLQSNKDNIAETTAPVIKYARSKLLVSSNQTIIKMINDTINDFNFIRLRIKSELLRNKFKQSWDIPC